MAASWPVIIQGIVGSLICWAILKLVGLLGRVLFRVLGNTTSVLEGRRKHQEYMYRRFTSRNGLINNFVGLHYAVSNSLRGLLMGLIFVCISFLFAGLFGLETIFSISLVGAIIYFGLALTWLRPSPKWTQDDNYTHWKRIAQLEKDLFGSVEEETERMISQFAPSRMGTASHPNE